MASGSFIPLNFCIWADGVYVTEGTFSRDVSIEQIESIVLTSQFPASDGSAVDTFRVVARDWHTLENQVYYLRTHGLTLANFLTAITALDSSSRFTEYTSLTMIDYSTADACDYTNVLLNDHHVNERIYNSGANTTDIQVDKKTHISHQIWTVTGDQSYAGNNVYL